MPAFKIELNIDLPLEEKFLGQKIGPDARVLFSVFTVNGSVGAVVSVETPDSEGGQSVGHVLSPQQARLAGKALAAGLIRAMQHASGRGDTPSKALAAIDAAAEPCLMNARPSALALGANGAKERN